jgi:hypothetical protein
VKIKKWVDMGAEVSVEVGVDDVRASLAEAFAVVTEDRLGEPGPNRSEIFMALNDIAIFLKAITDAQISLMIFGQLDKIQHFLLEQHNRFNAPLVAQAAYERGETPITSK